MLGFQCSLPIQLNSAKDTDTIENTKQNHSRIEGLLKNNNSTNKPSPSNHNPIKVNSNSPVVLNQIPSNIPANNNNNKHQSSIANSNIDSGNNSMPLKQQQQPSSNNSQQILKKKNSFINRKTIRNYTAAAASATSLPTSNATDNCLIVTPPASFNLANPLLLLQPAQATKQEQSK